MTKALRTTAVHGGYSTDDHLHAASTPIYATAAFDMSNAAHGDALSAGTVEGFSYSRVANPTVDVLERRLAALEGGVSAVAVASGMAAVSFALLCAAEGGGRIIAPHRPVRRLGRRDGDLFPQFRRHNGFRPRHQRS